MEPKIRISLAAARVNAKLTQKEAARALGLSVVTIQNYESGKTSPTWDIIKQMETVYGIPMDYINFKQS